MSYITRMESKDDQSTTYIETVPLLGPSPTAALTSLFLSHSKISKTEVLGKY